MPNRDTAGRTLESPPDSRHITDRTRPPESAAVRMIVLAAVAALVLAGIAAAVLDNGQRPAYEAFVGSGARVGDQPGTNLVGPKWDGLNTSAKQG